jgi:hypothetical protein
MARRQPGLGNSMTAVPHTAAIRASTCRRAQQPLRGSQREYAWQHPPAALAAKPSSAVQRRTAPRGTYPTLNAEQIDSTIKHFHSELLSRPAMRQKCKVGLSVTIFLAGR